MNINNKCNKYDLKNKISETLSGKTWCACFVFTNFFQVPAIRSEIKLS